MAPAGWVCDIVMATGAIVDIGITVAVTAQFAFVGMPIVRSMARLLIPLLIAAVSLSAGDIGVMPGPALELNDTFVANETPDYGEINTSWIVEPGNATASLIMTMPAAVLGSLPLDIGRTQLTAIGDVVELPDRACLLTAADHVELDWNPIGHGPTDGHGTGYGVAHFDVHLFLQPWSRDARKDIAYTSADSNTSGVETPFLVPPPDALTPADMVLDPTSSVPTQGIHWVNRDEYNAIYSPSKHGTGAFGIWSGFSFMQGSYNGTVTFVEIMVSLDYLLAMAAQRSNGSSTRVRVEGLVPQPRGGAAAIKKQWDRAGALPSSFFVEYDGSEGTRGTYSFGWRFNITAAANL